MKINILIILISSVLLSLGSSCSKDIKRSNTVQNHEQLISRDKLDIHQQVYDEVAGHPNASIAQKNVILADVHDAMKKLPKNQTIRDADIARIVENNGNYPGWAAAIKSAVDLADPIPVPVTLKTQSETGLPQLVYDVHQKIQPERSYYFSKKIDGTIHLVLTKSVPYLIDEVCVSYQQLTTPDLMDCYTNDTANLDIIFNPNNPELFQLKASHTKQCLTGTHDQNLIWTACNKDNQDQFFFREIPVYNDSNYNAYSFTHKGTSLHLAADGTRLFLSAQATSFYIRDSFPLLDVYPAVSKIPTKEEMDNFLDNSQFESVKKNNIFIFAVDTIRADAVVPEIMPEVSSFKDSSIHFDKTFSGATATYHSFFSLWNSRPSYEKNMFSSEDLHRKGSINLNVFNKMGYEIHAFGTYMSVIDEGLFAEGYYLSKRYYQLPGDKRIYRHIFGPDTHNINIPEDKFTSMSIRRQDTTVMDLFIDHINKEYPSGHNSNNSPPCLYIVYLNGSHTPYLVERQIEDKLISPYKKPAFFSTKPDDADYASVLRPEYYDWMYTALSSNRIEMINAYYNTATNVSYLVNRGLDAIKKAQLYDDSLVMFLSDHGESLYENASVGHGGTPLNKVTEIPLFYKFPKSSIPNLKNIKAKVGVSMDVFPTIFDYLGVKQRDHETIKLADLQTGRSIFSDEERCFVSTTPNSTRSPVEFAFFNGTEKLILRFRIKEVDEENFKPSENPLLSKQLEVIALTDYWDNPIADHTNLKQRFNQCFEQYFPPLGVTKK